MYKIYDMYGYHILTVDNFVDAEGYATAFNGHWELEEE